LRQLYDLASDKKPLTMQKADTVAARDYEPVQLAISPDDRYLAASGSKALFVWSLDTGQLLWQQDSPADDMTFLSDAASLWVLRGSELTQLSASDGKMLDHKPLGGKCRAVRLARGGRFLAALAGEPDKPGNELTVLPLPQMGPPVRWTVDKRLGSALDVSADGATVLLATEGTEFRFSSTGQVECCCAAAYDVNSKEPKWVFDKKYSLGTLRYTPGGQAVIVAGSYGGDEVVLDASSGMPMRLLPQAAGAGFPVLSAEGSAVWRFQKSDWDNHRLELWQLRRPFSPAAAN